MRTRTGIGRRRNWYYWIVTRDPETGKPYILPGGETDQKGNQHAQELLGTVDYELRRLPTTDANEASRLIKGRRLEKTHNLHKSVEKLGRKRSFVRRKNRGGF